jgi:hypothetical protein
MKFFRTADMFSPTLLFSAPDRCDGDRDIKMVKRMRALEEAFVSSGRRFWRDRETRR